MNVKALTYFLLCLTMLLIVFAFFVVCVWASVDEIDTYFENVRGQLLGFYGSEIVSHAAIILGLIIALPSTVSWAFKGLFKTMEQWAFFSYLTYSFVLIFIVLLTLYSVGRLFYWSALASSLTALTRESLVTGEGLPVNITELNVTSCMNAFANYTGYKFWNDQSFTSLLAQIFFPNNINGIFWLIVWVELSLGLSFLRYQIRYKFKKTS